MPRRPRALEPFGTYHLTARGNRRAAVFVDDDDRAFFLRVFMHTARRYGWRCLAYCFLTNHYHLLLWTGKSELAAGMRLLNSVHALEFNVRHGLEGHVFQDRYSSRLILGEEQLFRTIRYIARNPVRADMCRRPEDWPWSSYTALLHGGSHLLAEALTVFGSDPAQARRELRALVEEGLDDDLEEV